MAFGENYNNGAHVPDNERFYHIYEKVRDAQANARYFFLDSQELEDATSFFIDEEEYDIAGELVHYALEAFPSDTGFLLFKAELLIIAKDYVTARSLLDAVEVKEPYLATIYILRAAIYEAENNDEKALAEYEKALSIDVDEPEFIYEELGYYYLSKNVPEKALEWFIKYLDADRDNGSVFEVVTNIYIDTKNILDGLLFFEDFTGRYPDCPFAWFSAAHLFEYEKQYKKAVKAYEKGLQIDDSHIDAVLGAINCLRALNEYPRILKICNHYKDFNYPAFPVEKAETYLDMNETELALNEYMKIYEHDNTSTDAIVGISKIYKLNGFPDKALHYLNAGLDQNEDDVVLLIHKAFLLKDTGDFTEAVAIFESILDMEFVGDAGKIYFYLADTYLQADDLNASVNILIQGLETFEKDPELMFFLAACYYSSGDKEKAYALFEDAIAVDNEYYHIFFEKCTIAANDNLLLDIIRKNGII